MLYESTEWYPPSMMFHEVCVPWPCHKLLMGRRTLQFISWDLFHGASYLLIYRIDSSLLVAEKYCCRFHWSSSFPAHSIWSKSKMKLPCTPLYPALKKHSSIIVLHVLKIESLKITISKCIENLLLATYYLENLSLSFLRKTLF